VPTVVAAGPFDDRKLLVEAGRRRWAVVAQQVQPLSPMEWSRWRSPPDGQLLAVGRDVQNAEDGGAATLWDLADHTHIHQIGPALTGHEGSINTVAFTADGHILATGGGGAYFNGEVIVSNGEVILWDTTNRENPKRIGESLTGHRGNVAAAALTPDGRALATAGGEDGTILLWDITDLPRAHPTGHPSTHTPTRAQDQPSLPSPSPLMVAC
jgi:WD40 repeat protein